jgi:integral membrane sensor domain MASE1
MKKRPIMYLAKILLFIAVYVGAAKLGLSLAFLQAQVTPIWPPAGIALASILILGNKMWPNGHLNCSTLLII